MHIDNANFTKTKNLQEDVGMEFEIGKCVMLVFDKWKRETTEEIKRKPCDVMAKELDYGFKVIEFEPQLLYCINFGLMPLGKIWTSLSPQILVK